MTRLLPTRADSGQFRTRLLAFAAITLFVTVLPKCLHAQSGVANSAILQGFVRDSLGHAIPAAKVELKMQNGTQIQETQTDATGAYQFSSVYGGSYTLNAKKSGFSDSTVGPILIEQKGIKKVDLTLDPQKSSTAPEFFDEPQFTVAGVTDAANPGGHGSAATLRATDTLAKETASLGTTVPDKAQSSPAATEDSLRKAADREPESFEANYNLGKFLAENKRNKDALPYLERASKLNLEAQPRETQAQLHHLLGDVEEKLGNPLEAVREYQRAAELDPSEANLFDWGSDLLVHRALEPAIEVFTRGNNLFPHSVRMLVGLGVALYAHGSYDQATERLCQASDLDPADPNPYLVMGKIQSIESSQPDAILDRLARFARLQPDNALANYNYASSLWKRRSGPQDAPTIAQVMPLLQKAIRTDPRLGEAYLLQGIVFADQNNLPQAISTYQAAIAVTPSLAQAHYRLALAYRKTGDASKAKQELQLYEEASKKTAEDTERERHEIQQFVYTLQSPAPASKPQ